MKVIKEMPLYIRLQRVGARSIKFINVSWFQLSYFRKNISQSTNTMVWATGQKLVQWPASQRTGYTI